MAARLIGMTSSSNLRGGSHGLTLQEFIAYCARVSNPANQMNHETSGKLLRYCADNGHWSVFEMANAVIEIETTRDISRQILRHRSFTFQEYSQRYAEVNDDLKPVIRETRMQDSKNRQNSLETSDENLHAWWEKVQKIASTESKKIYHAAIEKGIAKEVARAVLPEGLTPTTLIVNGTIRSWIHYLQTRTHPSTQKEHRQIALECASCLQPEFPMIYNFLESEK